MLHGWLTGRIGKILILHIDMVDDTSKVGTNLRRLFRIYDYLAFGKHTKLKGKQY